MTMEDFVKLFEGIKDNKVVCIPYQLHRDNQINNIIDALGGVEEAFNYFSKVLEAESANIYTSVEEYQKRLNG